MTVPSDSETRCPPGVPSSGRAAAGSAAPPGDASLPAGADRRRPTLDDAARGERGSALYRAAGRAPVGGSNRLLSVDELAAYLGVPKKTVYGCWRQWGLRGYRVGRYLRFRERHVEEWLRNQEA